MTTYRAAVIGLGWMGMLYDLAERPSVENPVPQERFQIDDVDRPTPTLNLQRRFHHHAHPGNEGLPTSYAEALWDRPEVTLVAAADRDSKRLAAFAQRYGVQALYTDAEALFQSERPEIVAVCTNTKGRADLVCAAVTHGARAIFTEKPMVHTLAEADRMVQSCAAASVPLNCGAISTTHPSFARAKGLLQSGAIGKLISMETDNPFAQHQNWVYFLGSAPLWVVGYGDQPRRASGSDEFVGEGILMTDQGLMLHFRHGAPGVRLTGDAGEMSFVYHDGWRLWQDLETLAGRRRVEVPWPEPQFVPPYGAVYALADILDCLAGKLDEPKNSGRRVALALEVEIALKLSAAQGGVRVDLPLQDRSLGLNYDWFR